MSAPRIQETNTSIDKTSNSTLSKYSQTHLPTPGSIIVPTTTSPLDTLYLAAVFDPLFIRTYPNTRLIHTQSFLSALLFPLSPSSLHLGPPQSSTSSTSTLTTLPALLSSPKHRSRILLLPAESTPTNSRAILPLSPALATAPRHTKIFPTSLRYNPPDVTTPVPGWRGTWRFLWCLCGRGWTHTVRVRIGGALRNEEGVVDDFDREFGNGNGHGDGDENDKAAEDDDDDDERVKRGDDAPLSASERRLLDRVAETLARLGRVRRVALGVREKGDFVRLWRRRGRG